MTVEVEVGKMLSMMGRSWLKLQTCLPRQSWNRIAKESNEVFLTVKFYIGTLSRFSLGKNPLKPGFIDEDGGTASLS